MGFGVFLLCAICVIFTVTHGVKYTPDQSPWELAGELIIIALTGLFLYISAVILRNLV
jgi:hypothetical protein